MAHELGTCGQRDRLRVNIADAPELNSWCAEFGCTPIQLRNAIGRVGVMAADVSAFLEREAGSGRGDVRSGPPGCGRAL